MKARTKQEVIDAMRDRNNGIVPTDAMKIDDLISTVRGTESSLIAMIEKVPTYVENDTEAIIIQGLIAQVIKEL